MKNTKHNEFLDQNSSNPEISSSKRKILTSLGVSSGILGASALSQHWVKPVVNSVILPAHAQTTPGETTTTTTTEAPGPMIMVESSNITGMVGDDGSTIMYKVKLSEQPTDTVTVAVAATAGASVTTPSNSSLTFTRFDYSTAQDVTVTTAAGNPSATNPDVTVTFTASGGGFDNVKATNMFTVVENDNVSATNVKATVGTVDGVANTAPVTVTWDAPKTTAKIRAYVVATNVSGDAAPDPATMRVGPSATMAVFPSVPVSNESHTFSVTVDYESGEDGAAVNASPVTVS